MNVTFENVGGLDNRELHPPFRDKVYGLKDRYQPIERNGCFTSSLPGIIPAIRDHTAKGCVVPWSTWYRYVYFDLALILTLVRSTDSR